MKIGVVSDTHTSMVALQRAIEVLGDVDAWFHLGDEARDIMRIADTLQKPIYAVRGNCDYMSDMPSSQVVEIGGKRFFLTHGHKYAVNHNTSLLCDEAYKLNCDAAIYGHTHIPLIEYSKVRILNPGSTTKPLGGYKASCALITIDDDNMRFDIINLNQ